MDKMKDLFKKSLMCLLTVTMLGMMMPSGTFAFTEQVIQIGATGDDVVELQARLQYIGYYHGRIDGVFGWQTYWSVRNFQHDFGIDVDGYAGPSTKQKLVERTHFDYDYVHGQINKGEYAQNYGPDRGPEGAPPPGQRDPGVDRRDRAAPAPEGAPPAEGQVGQMQEAVNLPEGFSDNDIRLMANAVYGEARGEPYRGQVAVAAVILNRVQDSRFPNTVAGVIYEPRAFTVVADGQINLEPDETARRAVMDAVNGWDPTGGLVFYFNPRTATSGWMFGRERVLEIGKHVFVR